MPNKKHDIKELENALQELEQQVENIDLPDDPLDKAIVCPFCYKKLVINDKDQILDFCIKCNSSIKFYHLARTENNFVKDIILVSADFY